MKFIQYYLDCLSHASYLIADETTGRAVVVDPQRDVAEYLRDAEEFGYTIELVIETHFHADFLSGHLELAEATGAKIVYSSVAETEFDSMGVADGERYSLGEVTLEFRHTPGHTPESMSIVVYEHADDDGALRGADRRRAVHRRRRPAGPAGLDRVHPRRAGREAVRLAARQADDAARRHPGLSRPTARARPAARTSPPNCARPSASRRRPTTRCAPRTRPRSWSWSPRGSRPPRPTSSTTPILNRKDRELLDESEMPTAMTYDQMRAAMNAGAILVDGRSPEEFALGHLRDAINIGLEGRYAEFAGSVRPVRRRHRAVHRTRRRNWRARTRLARIGFDRVIGYLDRPFEVMFDHQGRRPGGLPVDRQGVRPARGARWPTCRSSTCATPERSPPGRSRTRSPSRWASCPPGLGELDPAKPTVVYCAGGYRSSVAASLLRHNGFTDVSDILGGYGAWEAVHQNA